MLSGCTVPTFGAHYGATSEARDSTHLWQGFTIGAIVIGGFTFLLIVFAAIRYRARRGDASLPRQTQYHLPLEFTYTIIPVIVVLILFGFTVAVENVVTALPAPKATVKVQAFQWGWSFSYPGFTVVGQTLQTPTMVIPADENVRIVLTSLDVVHDFYVRQFNFARYAQPGVTNEFTFNALSPGTYFGQCTQLCGLYHSLMWFQVKVVPPAQYAAWLTSERKNAAALAAEAAGLSARQQTGTGIPIKPYYGGGVNSNPVTSGGTG